MENIFEDLKAFSDEDITDEAEYQAALDYAMDPYLGEIMRGKEEESVLIVVDMQKDFIDGTLGTKEAVAMLSNAIEFIKSFDGDVIYTMDTHDEYYLSTREGKYLPVKHCIKGTPGWEINKDVLEAGEGKTVSIFEKPTFGSEELVEFLKSKNYKNFTLLGLCTDICVVSNALLIKAAFKEEEVNVVSSCSAGVSVESHDAALLTMKMCQINII